MVQELEAESGGLYNAVAYDYRLSQIYFEASGSITSTFPFPRLYKGSNPEAATPSKMAKFQAWWKEMGYTGFFKQSKVVANFGLKKIFEDLNGALIVHGKQYNPMEPSKRRRRLSSNEAFPMCKSAKEEFDKKTDVPFLWLIHGTGTYVWELSSVPGRRALRGHHFDYSYLLTIRSTMHIYLLTLYDTFSRAFPVSL